MALTRGEFRAPAAPGSTSEVMVKLSDKRAFGTLDGKQAGALIVTTSVGGTGTFYELALLGRSEQGWVNTDSVLLGDRINLHSVSIENDQIVVAMTTHGPRDRCAAPRWKRRGGGRFETIDSWRSPTRHPGSARSRERPDSGCTRSTTTASAPRLPSPRTIRCAFRTAARSTSGPTATGRGTYAVEGKHLSIEIKISTMAACEPGLLEEPFARDLAAGAIHFFRDGELYIDLKYDTGRCDFGRSARAPALPRRSQAPCRRPSPGR